MCGITGFSSNKPQQPGLISKLLNKIEHRGPNSKNTFLSSEKKIGLGHARLSVIDTSDLGNQPMNDLSGRYTIVYNGEIYNYLELKKKYLNDIKLKSKSDTEVILELYKIFKTKILNLLNGMFAFVIYDKVEKELFIARDHLGIKPLYTYQSDQSFYFSSEFKSFLEIEGFDKSINYSSLFDHLTFLRSTNQNTIFKKVKKIKPGEFIRVKDGKIIEKSFFFNLSKTFKKVDISFLDAKNKTLSLLENSVQKQLRSDIPLGFMLSGGVDSSSIITIAKKYSQKRMEAFTINLEPKELKFESITDDLPYAKKVAKSLDVKLNVVDIDNDLESLIQKMIYHLDEPIPDLAAMHVYLITKLAKEQGCPVLLSGIGGDDIFSGYRRHEALFYESFYIFLPKELLKFINFLFNKLSFFPHRLKRLFLYSYLLKNERLLSYYYWLKPEIVKEILTPKIRHELSLSTDNEKITIKTLESLDELSFSNLNKMLYIEQSSFLPDHNLLYNDKMSMANGVEIRVPFLDLDLVKFANSLPDDLKLNLNKSKFILKHSLDGTLSKDIINRKKTGFGVPLRYWLDNSLKTLADELTSEDVIKKRGLFNIDKVKNLKNLNQNKKIDASYTIFSLMCIEIWSKNFLDSKKI